MKILTNNNKPRPLYALCDLDEKDIKDFDYIKDDTQPRICRYKGNLYDVLDTQRIEVKSEHTSPMGWSMYVEPTDPLAQWDAVTSESYFSGVLFRLAPDDQVICGRYYS